MPSYEFRCDTCGHTKFITCSMEERDQAVSCDPCKGLPMARVLSVSGFHYPYGGREEFHGPTIRERQERQISEAKSVGLDPEPVGTRWV